MSETSLLPAYLIVGTDGVKRDHAVSRMKARLEKSGMVEFNLDERDMTKDPDRVDYRIAQHLSHGQRVSPGNP